MERQEIKDRWKHKLLKENCTPKQIRAQVAQLKQEKQLPQSKKDYRPNIKGIQHVYGENAGEIKAVMAEAYMTGDPLAETYQNGDDIIAGMLKEVILCDYEKRDYQLLPPKSTSQQLEDLTDNVKQAFIRDYKACYNE